MAKMTRDKNKLYTHLLEQHILELSEEIEAKDKVIQLFQSETQSIIDQKIEIN